MSVAVDPGRPFTVTAPDGTLGFRGQGTATFEPATKGTAFTGALVVLVVGTGRYANSGGTANAVGSRVDALGGQVDFDVTTTLTGVPR